MIKSIKIPKTVPITIQWIVKLWGIYCIIFTLFRVATVLLFRPSWIPVTSLFPALWLGFRFDAKWISIILSPIVLLSLNSKFSPFYSEKNKSLWSYYLAFTTLIILFFFGADFGNFSYNHTRINASALNFAEDPGISFKMLWQSYPVIWIVLMLAIAVFMIAKLFRSIHVHTLKKNLQQNIIYKKRWHAAAIIFMAWCMFGIFSFRPLKWSEAFKFNNNFKSNLALNPLQNFFTTLRFRSPSFDDVKAKKCFSLMAEFLKLDSFNMISKNYERNVDPGSKALESRPNVVLVVCESFSMYKSSMSDNPLNTTPYFNGLCKEGIFFDRCFSATFGTARGVFAILTGIPDVQLSKFSTRNPEAVDQRTIINNFEAYNKYYFLGGSSDFNNFDGLIQNIKGVKIYQEGLYKSKPLNVWGISDKNLFLEANNVFRQQKTPFFAIIQTADNHRPYSIPEEDGDFEKRIVSPDSLRKYGFESLQEFHAFCYTDYCFQKFIESAKHESYFTNTIFIFVGDHGVEGEASQMYPDAWTAARLSDEHVPLLFYAPALFTPQRRGETVSQIDVLPTLAGLIHEPYINTTLGRDLLNTKNKKNAAFIIHHDEGNIGVVTDEYYYIKNIRINKEDLVPTGGNNLNLTPHQEDSVKSSLSELTTAIYETAKWMLVNNKPHTTD
jgi:phosphoglycerol transferase MdoB-like AlkP superfamily enzyme